MKKIKKLFKSRIFICILTALIVGTVSVSAATYFQSNQVTYDNTESGLTSTNVQGAIDELYNTCQNSSNSSISNYILNNVDIVTSGDGLYKDEYEEGRYVYKGNNPNNYITFNGEKAAWRIISIEKDGSIKIIRHQEIENRAWDTSNSNNWARPATLNTYLNETYYNKIIASSRKLIIAHDFGIGAVTYGNDNLTEQINDENSVKWHGYIALPTVSDIIRSSSDKEKCSTFKQFEKNSYSSCMSTWMYNDEYWWYLSPVAGTTDRVYELVTDLGPLIQDYPRIEYNGVRPTLYLSLKTQRNGGTGTKSDPYTIE